MTAFAFIDTETDGLGPHRHMWEVAIIRLDSINGDLTEVGHHQFFLSGLDLAQADPKALNVGRFWDRHPHARELTGKTPVPNDVLTPGVAARKILALTHDAVLVGVNPQFDAHCFERLLRGNNLTPTWDYRLINIRDLATGWLLGQGHSIATDEPTEELSRRCGIDVPDSTQRHTAMGDAEWVQRWFYKIALGQDRP